MGNDIKTTAELVENNHLPRARVAHADPDAPQSSEQKPLPDAVKRKSVEEKSEAEWAYQRIILYIKDFEEQLDTDHEVAMGFTGGSAGVMRIEGVGFFDPDIITFYGQLPDGTRTQMIQHVSQLNVMLQAVTKVDRTAKPARIGFRLAAELENDEDSD